MYRIETDKDGYLHSITRLSDMAGIPKLDRNKDYQEFLKWNAKQPKPLIVPDYKPTPKIPNIIQEFLDLEDGKATDAQRDAVLKALIKGTRYTPEVKKSWFRGLFGK